MRRAIRLCLALLLPVALVPCAARAQPAQPPHAWLFGTWTGGMFPTPPRLGVQACLSQPVVIFSRDLVMRATLTERTLTQREIQTVRVVPSGVEFRFTGPLAPDSSLLGLGSAGGLVGFGCESSDVLHVERQGDNAIAFPGCADFPNPLVRCR